MNFFFFLWAIIGLVVGAFLSTHQVVMTSLVSLVFLLAWIVVIRLMGGDWDAARIGFLDWIVAVVILNSALWLSVLVANMV